GDLGRLEQQAPIRGTGAAGRPELQRELSRGEAVRGRVDGLGCRRGGECRRPGPCRLERCEPVTERGCRSRAERRCEGKVMAPALDREEVALDRQRDELVTDLEAVIGAL